MAGDRCSAREGRRALLTVGAALLGTLCSACPPSKPPQTRPMPPKPTPVKKAGAEREVARVCSSDRWCWTNPMPQGNDLRAIWVRSARDIVIVGDAGTALLYNGRSWRREPTGQHRDLLAAWAPALDERPGGADSSVRYAAGRAGTLVVYRDGRWAALATGSSADLDALWGDRLQLYAAGTKGTILRCARTGRGRCDELPTPGDVDLHALAGTAGDDLFAVGDRATVLHYDGKRWKRLSLRGGAAGGPRRSGATEHSSLRLSVELRAATVVGGALVAGGDRGTLLRCKASGCTALASGTTADVLDLWSTGDRLAVLVRDGAGSRIREYRAVGRQLQPAEKLRYRTRRSMLALGGSSEGGLLLVGEAGSVHVETPKGWQEAMPSGPRGGFDAVWGFGAGDVFAAGRGGIVAHFDGRSWEDVRSHTRFDLHALASTSRRSVRAVGANGTVLRCDIRDCVVEPTPTRNDLFGVTRAGGVSWAVGRGGVVLERKLDRWQRIESGVSEDLFAVAAAGSSVYIAGAGGTILRVKGDGVERLTTPVHVDLVGLSGGEGGKVYAVGARATVLVCDDTQCRALPSPPQVRSTLRDAYVAKGALEVVGAPRAVFRFAIDSAQWKRQTTGYAGELRAIWSAPDGRAFAVGDDGVILERLP